MVGDFYLWISASPPSTTSLGQISIIPQADSKPWLIFGGLSELFSSDEKRSFNKGNSTRNNNFNNFINHKNFIDLGFYSNYYTWHNKREKHAANFSRLDRVMANSFWIKL